MVDGGGWTPQNTSDLLQLSHSLAVNTLVDKAFSCQPWRRVSSNIIQLPTNSKLLTWTTRPKDSNVPINSTPSTHRSNLLQIKCWCMSNLMEFVEGRSCHVTSRHPPNETSRKYFVTCLDSLPASRYCKTCGMVAQEPFTPSPHSTFYFRPFLFRFLHQKCDNACRKLDSSGMTGICLWLPPGYLKLIQKSIAGPNKESNG